MQINTIRFLFNFGQNNETSEYIVTMLGINGQRQCIVMFALMSFYDPCSQSSFLHSQLEREEPHF